MDIARLELDKNKLLKMQEEYFKQLINSIKNKDKEIDEYKNKLAEAKEENFKLEVQCEILARRLSEQEEVIDKLRKEILNAKNDTVFNELMEFYINNEDENVEDKLFEIIYNIKEFEDKVSKENLTILMYIAYLYDQLEELLNESVLSQEYYESKSNEGQLLRLLQEQNNFKLYNIVNKVPQSFIEDKALFSGIQDNIKEKIIESILDISYRAFESAELLKNIEDKDKLTVMTSWVKNKDSKSWTLVKGLYSQKDNKFYMEADKADKLNLNIPKDKHEKLILNESVNKLKRRFIKYSPSYFEKFIVAKNTYNGMDNLINTIINSDISKNNLNECESRTLLLISFFFGFTNHLLNKSEYLKEIFRGQSVEGELIRLLDVEKSVKEQSIIKMPVKIFIRNNKDRIQNIDPDVKNKIIELVDLYFYDEFTKLVVTESDVKNCHYDKSELTLNKGYLEFTKNKPEVRYVLFSEKSCSKCKTVYIDINKYNNFDSKYGRCIVPTKKLVLDTKKNNKLDVENGSKDDKAIKMYDSLLREFNLNNANESVLLFKKIVENEDILKQYNKMQYMTLLFIGYLAQKNTYAAEKIKALAKFETSSDTILYNRVINGKDFNDYIKTHKNFFSLIDPKVKQKLLMQLLNIGAINRISNSDNSLKDGTYENNLSAESVIKKLGYSTTLGREARWNILKNKIVPAVGKAKTISHISFLIRMNQKRGNRENALNEWRYDLERLLRL